MFRASLRSARTRVALLLVATGAIGALAACGGSESVLVPDVEGLSVGDAAERVCSRFLEPRLEEAAGQASDGAARVVGSRPPAGEQVDVDAAVTLLVAVPDGSGLPPEPACD